MMMGAGFISIAFVAALVSATAYTLYYKDRLENLFKLANRSYWVMSVCIVGALTMLVYSIMNHNFQLNYVYSYSSTALENKLLFATLWAGQEGTFLMWLFYGAIYGVILMWLVGRKRPLVMSFLLIVQSILLLILLKKNPFSMIWHLHSEVPIGFMPPDGAGLNPLLQNPWMVIHPPTLFVGYSSTVVPFAFAMSALVSGDYRNWIKDVQPWVIFNVMILGTGIIMGGYWAYVTLGWGGYWGWDPVENASLVPWIFSVILLHGIMIQQKRGSLVKSNLFFAGMSFLTMIWGSYLTRSGVLTDFSVHSFAPSGLSFYLIMFQGVVAGIFLFFYFRFIYRYRRTRETQVKFEGGILNRESFIWIGMIILLLISLIVLAGTSAPLYTGWFGKAASVSPAFYNSMIIPAGIFLLLMLSIAPLLAWKTVELRNIPTLLGSAAGALLLTLGAVILGLSHFASVALFFLAVFCILVNARVGLQLLGKNSLRIGGYLAHIGWAFMIIGIVTSSIYDNKEKVLLPNGEFHKTELGYQIKFVGFKKMPNGKDRAQLSIKTAHGAYEAEPEFYYSDYSRGYMVSPDVRSEFLKDVYISPISFTPAEWNHQREVELGKQQTANVNDLHITFNKFLVKMGGGAQEVTANLIVKLKTDSTESYTLNPTLKMENGAMKSSRAQVPNSEYYLKIASVNATEGKVQLIIELPDQNKEKAQDVLAVEVSEKPLISILWFGTFVFIAGALLTLGDRIKSYKKDR